jgi:glycosyltransferase involved in cell wall biosynthesis
MIAAPLASMDLEARGVELRMDSEFAATIVIPLLDQVDEWLRQCVRSALMQTVRCEVLVVLSPITRQSNLELLEALKLEFHNLRVLPRETLGFPGAINAGFKAASADRIGLLLSDDWLDPRAVEACFGQNADIVSGGNKVFDADGSTVFPGLGQTPRMDEFLRCKTLETRARYLQHFFLFRKRKLLEIGGADESLGDFPGIDDFDMIWTLLERGATVAIVEQQLYRYRDHSGERLTLRCGQQAATVLQRILDKHGIIEPERTEIIREHLPWYGRPMHVVFEEMRNQESRDGRV